MQFITDGPDIPNELLQAHEEGKVVFFCGAGVSYPAGLKGFKDLVEELYHLSGEQRNPVEEDAFQRKQYDATLELLERRLVGNRAALRKHLLKVLKPNCRWLASTNSWGKKAIETHAALLRLSRTKEGSLRLVTTNFDRLFQLAGEASSLQFNEYSAPMLPIPKASRWDGLVYLHGLLPTEDDEVALNRLVLTSGDFGLAYLIERWAARFVSDLFRNHVVCFVGYSLNDPVLRYMMDALAADRILGEETPQAWAFGDCSLGNEDSAAKEWQAKGVKPILYNVPHGSRDHSALHKTLKRWAETYRDGVQGKEAIIARHAAAHPQRSTKQDDFVGRVLWALSDQSGLPAKRFAEHHPVPSLDWLLTAFSETCFSFHDLPRFGVAPAQIYDEDLKFSLINRPAPYSLSPSMALSGMSLFSNWDDVMLQLGYWLTKHLNDPRLIYWVVEQGAILNERFKFQVRGKINELAEQASNEEALELIRENSPNAIPSKELEIIWNLLIAGRVKTHSNSFGFGEWIRELNRSGLTHLLRLELREILAPKVTIEKPLFSPEEEALMYGEKGAPFKAVSCKIELSANYVEHHLRDIESPAWRAGLPVLREEFQLLLCDALDLSRELGDADDKNDNSYVDLPSIEPHEQNRGYNDWVCLIELLRDSWKEVLKEDCHRATRIAEDWFFIEYPTFKRLALFAASKDGCVASPKWVSWLVDCEPWVLWSSQLKREVCRLLVLQGGELSSVDQSRLEKTILIGPDRENYRDDLSDDEWKRTSEYSIWLRLAKLKSSGCGLGDAAEKYLKELESNNLGWKIENNESDEFAYWASGFSDSVFEDQVSSVEAPRELRALKEWLKKPINKDPFFYKDNWRDMCGENFCLSLSALRELLEEGEFPLDRWASAIGVWSDGDKVERSWNEAAPLIKRLPSDFFKKDPHSIAMWLKKTSSVVGYDELWFELCGKVFDAPLSVEGGVVSTRNGVEFVDYISLAINHPFGHVTEALINKWLAQEPNDNDGLPEQYKSIFTELCDLKKERYLPSRVILATYAVTLYRVDISWSKQYLLPLLDWEDAKEANAAWQGFLRSNRVYPPLLYSIKEQFIKTASRYDEISARNKGFASILTFAALERVEGFTVTDFQLMFRDIPQDGLDACSYTIYQLLESARDNREEYWKYRVKPLISELWPKDSNSLSSEISSSFGRIVIAARGEFPSAFNELKRWLQPIDDSSGILSGLEKSGICSDYPKEALEFIDVVVKDGSRDLYKLDECLTKIGDACPDLNDDGRYRRLIVLSRRA